MNVFGKIPEKLFEGILYLQRNFPFYFEFMLNIELIQTDKIPTAGIRMNKNLIELSYNYDNYWNKISLQELVFDLIHEIFHIFLKFDIRLKGRDKNIFNIAQDMIINNLIKTNFNFTLSEKFIKEYCIWIPKDYTGELITEEVYDFLMKYKDKYKDMKNFDVHLDDFECPPEIKEIITDRILSICKARGYITSNEENILNIMRPKKHNYIEKMMELLSDTIGIKKKFSWARENKYGLELRGYKRVRNKVNAIIDTSGSMWGELINKMLTFIMRNNVEIFLIQNDTEVKDARTIRRINELKALKIKGGGGTVIQPAIDHLIKTKMTDNPTILLTDGYTDELNFSAIKNKVLILTSAEKCNLIGKQNHVRQIKVEL